MRWSRLHRAPAHAASLVSRADALQRASLAFSRAAAMAPLRELDETDPATWEFSGFSQNGEDGLLDVLARALVAPDRDFAEIGASDGLENNTAWLALGRRYAGVMVEGDEALAERAAALYRTANPAVRCVGMRVEPADAAKLLALLPSPRPDVFSLDIDGNDLHVVKALLEAGLRPKIAVVEYNSAFGPDAAVTIPYQPSFDYRDAHPSLLYYGASVGGWRALFERHGLRFLTVDVNGVNAFFVDPDAFDPTFLQSVEGTPFRENLHQRARLGGDWQSQSRHIDHLPRLDVAELLT